ncbi:uncharacterized protein EI97DRAFT_443791 [Westerdykella ornata]|uniref:Uncharacterized protein n=1 Tax=Westerdykella ornata TaxID=318751 RepID=A0A6A6JFE7_WESOR|nr:uncharacterized protein EI97DRAFT_443791 [Westerdykella ornata]KAF2274934.1 hypothetical protein EI97DRAFT_443791 [Westerdykella ornata]
MESELEYSTQFEPEGSWLFLVLATSELASPGAPAAKVIPLWASPLWFIILYRIEGNGERGTGYGWVFHVLMLITWGIRSSASVRQSAVRKRYSLLPEAGFADISAVTRDYQIRDMQTGRRYRPNRQPRGDGSDGGRGGSSGGRGRGRGRGGNGRLGQNDDGGNSTSATNTTTTNNQPTPSPSHPRALSHRNFQPSPSRLSRSVFQTRQPRPPRHNHPPVPPRSALVPGTTRVSIILKQDQSTGRQVQGVVEQILTRGDHPRGVKVRLRDGRVGRVQGVLGDGDGGEGTAGGAGVERVLGDEEESARGAVEGGQANQNQNGNSTSYAAEEDDEEEEEEEAGEQLARHRETKARS